MSFFLHVLYIVISTIFYNFLKSVKDSDLVFPLLISKRKKIMEYITSIFKFQRRQEQIKYGKANNKK